MLEVPGLVFLISLVLAGTRQGDPGGMALVLLFGYSIFDISNNELGSDDNDKNKHHI